MEGTTTLKSLLSGLGLDMKMADRYFKIHRTVIEMLSDRGFEISEEELQSTDSLISFMNYMFSGKTLLHEEFLKDLIFDLYEKQSFVGKESDLEEFLEDRLLSLARRLDSTEIVKELSSNFKVKDKLLSSVVGDKISKHLANIPDSIEILNRIYENKTGKKIFVYYFLNVDDDKKESRKKGEDILTAVKEQQDKPENRDLKDVLLVVENKLNSGTMENLKFKERIKFTIFLGDHLLFNITKHFLVPKHKLISKKEFQELMESKEKGFVQNLPKIYDSDPISRYYGAKVGQIFKITRETLADDSMVKTDIFYRHVIPEVIKK
jgi:DNA-directed RNA polymerase subunit H (RpoH/RPB5)